MVGALYNRTHNNRVKWSTNLIIQCISAVPCDLGRVCLGLGIGASSEVMTTQKSYPWMCTQMIWDENTWTARQFSICTGKLFDQLIKPKWSWFIKKNTNISILLPTKTLLWSHIAWWGLMGKFAKLWRHTSVLHRSWNDNKKFFFEGRGGRGVVFDSIHVGDNLQRRYDKRSWMMIVPG